MLHHAVKLCLALALCLSLCPAGSLADVRPDTAQNLAQINHLADSLLDERSDGCYEKVLSLLDRVDPGWLARAPRLDQSNYHYMRARYYFGIGEYDSSSASLIMAHDLSKAIGNDSLYYCQMMLWGLLEGRKGRHEAALQAFESVVDYRLGAGDTNMVYGPVNNQALIYFGCGDLRKAIELMNKALAYANQYGSLPQQQLCEQNLARFLIIAGNFSAFDALMAGYKASDFTGYRKASILQQRGMAAVFSLEYDMARQYLKESLEYYTGEGMWRDIWVCLEYLGLNEYFNGNYSEARKYYDKILYGHNKPILSVEAQTLRQLTDLLLAQDSTKRALEVAHHAEKIILEINEQIELGAIYRAYGLIYDRFNSMAKARECFERSISILKKTGACYELALTYKIYSQCRCYSKAEKLSYSNQADSLFQNMGIEKFPNPYR